MPKQRATIAPKPQTQEVAPGVQQALPLPQPQIETPDDADPVADAFTREAGREPLPSEAARSTPGAAAGETPLFTTTDDAADRGRPNRNATATATRPDPSFSTGPAVTSTGGSTPDTNRAPGDRTPLDSTEAPNPLVAR